MAATARAGQEVAEQVLEAAGVGGWNFDIASGRLIWTRVTFLIHDMKPGPVPTVDQAIGYYAPQARPVIEAAVRAGIETGAPWDLELPLVTAKGRPIWVRACGIAIRDAGRTVQLTGSFEDVTVRHEHGERSERMAVVARQMTNAVIITDADGQTEWVNDAFGRLTGYTLEEFRGRAPGTLLQGPDTDPGTIETMRACLARGEGFEVEILNYTRKREPYWMAVACTPLRDPAGRLTGFIAVETDISLRRRAEDEVRRETIERQRAEALLRDVLDALPTAVTAYDSDERLVLANRAYGEMFPISAGFALPGCPLRDVLSQAAQNGQFPDAGTTPAERQRWIDAAVAAHRNPGQARSLALPNGRFVQAREQRSETGNLVCVRTDTTDLKRAEGELRQQAEHDPLTALANRSAFLHALGRSLDGACDPAARGTARTGALLLFDIDYFKQINDTFGHDLGDALLIEVGMRLRANARQGDVAARLGGDEFAVLMPGLAGPQAVAERMAAIQAALGAPASLGHRQLSATFSGGVTVFPRDGTTAEQLLKNADLAMYEAKRLGRARWCAFIPEQAAAQEQHSRVAVALRTALAEGAIVAALQPKCRLGGGHAGFEALARWYDGTRWVPPSEFVPVAEEVGLMGPLGRAVMETALSRLRALRDLGHRPGRVAVNLSGQQLLDQAFLSDTLACLERHRLGPADLEFEVTEAVLVGRTAERVDAALREFSALGFTLALDDFGTGFASLAHLARLPIDRLKIDRSFVAEIGRSSRGEVIARSVIGLARSLGMRSVAEGVETPEQLAFLAAEGCDEAQGYLLGRPLLSLKETAAYLASLHQDCVASPYPSG